MRAACVSWTQTGPHPPCEEGAGLVLSLVGGCTPCRLTHTFNIAAHNSTTAGELGGEEPAGQDYLEGGQLRKALLAQRRQIPSEARDRLSTADRAEGAGDLLLYLEQPQIPL